MVFLDTNIIIYLSKELLSFDDIIDENKEYCISTITYMEVMGYSFNSIEEEDFIKEFISYFKIIYVDKAISNKVIELRKIYKIKLPDAIICASCIVHSSLLITNDIRLKSIKELKIQVTGIE